MCILSLSHSVFVVVVAYAMLQIFFRADVKFNCHKSFLELSLGDDGVEDSSDTKLVVSGGMDLC